ncbi:MAG: MobC family plasmid mobilization relaxosome protein, partial [Oscillospiraceae bacterium]|nr:MobC family plasmid mobilization relaxosome protein [Oscillospiraceae bacterium]
MPKKNADTAVFSNMSVLTVNKLNRLLGIFGNNVNQISRRANETGNVYAADVVEVLKRQDEIWNRQKEILRRLGDIQDA